MTSELPDGVGILRFDEIASTSDEARRLAETGAPGPLWITAKRQTAGRGRRGRVWVSEIGNLYATLLLRPAVATASAGQFSFLAAVALAEAIEDLLPPRYVLNVKWPNDLLVENRKVAGILLESQGRPDGGLDWLSIGIGVNLRSAPDGTETPAAALGQFGVDIDAERLLARLAAAFERVHGIFRAQGFGPIRDAWLRRAAGLGRPIEVRLQNRVLFGRFAALDESGALVLDQEGTRTLIASGEVFLTE